MSGASPDVIQEGDDEFVPKFPHANITAVRAMAGAIDSTLGPRSRDKMVVSALASEQEVDPLTPSHIPVTEFTVANDGGRILLDLPLEHPIAPIVRHMIGPERPGETDVVGQDIYDGVTAAVVLTAALLDEAEDLVDRGVHPYDVRRGFLAAQDVALDALDAATMRLDAVADQRAVETQVARAAMTGNDVGGYADVWATLAVDAVDAVGMPDERTFVVRQLSKGAIDDSRLVEGAVLDVNHRINDEMPKRVEDATVLLLDGHQTGGLMEQDLGGMDVTIDLSSLDQVDEMEAVHAHRRKRLIDHYESLGVDVVVTRLGIDKAFQDLLTERGMVGIRTVNKLDMKQLSLATGARLVRNPDDVDADDLGHASVVEEVMREPRRGRRKNRFMTVFEVGPDSKSVVMLLQGVSDQLADQATTEVRKAAKAVAVARGLAGHRPGVVAGAGAIELTMAEAVRESATSHQSKAQLAVTAFADALEAVVAKLVANAGFDRLDSIADLKAARSRGQSTVGFLLPDGVVGDAVEAGVLDPAAYKRRQVVSATEVSDLVLKVDDAIDATFTKEPADAGESIYDERAEAHEEYLQQNPSSQWDTK